MKKIVFSLLTTVAFSAPPFASDIRVLESTSVTGSSMSITEQAAHKAALKALKDAQFKEDELKGAKVKEAEIEAELKNVRANREDIEAKLKTLPFNFEAVNAELNDHNNNNKDFYSLGMAKQIKELLEEKHTNFSVNYNGNQASVCTYAADKGLFETTIALAFLGAPLTETNANSGLINPQETGSSLFNAVNESHSKCSSLTETPSSSLDPLSMAARYATFKQFKMLFELANKKGLNIQYVDAKGDSLLLHALHQVKEKADERIAEMLLKNGVTVTPSHLKFTKNLKNASPELIKLLKDKLTSKEIAEVEPIANTTNFQDNWGTTIVAYLQFFSLLIKHFLTLTFLK